MSSSLVVFLLLTPALVLGTITPTDQKSYTSYLGADVRCSADADCLFYGRKCCVQSGKCFDPSFQTCCRGSVCVTAYEKCCNSTCCNQFTSRCQEFTFFVGPVDVCTDYNWLSPSRGFLVVGIPIITIVFFFLLAVTLVYAFQQSRTSSKLQYLIILFGAYGYIVGMMLVFSPMWFNGVLTVLFSSAVIGAACCPTTFTTLGALSVLHVLLLLYTNPYAPNWPLSFGSDTPGGWLMEMHDMLEQSFRTTPNIMNRCSRFYYAYWHKDPSTIDDRITNPKEWLTGYCKREWLLALYIVMLFKVCTMVLLHGLLVLLAARVSRFFQTRDEKTDVVQM